MKSTPSEIVTKAGAAYHLGLKPEQIHPNLFLVGDPARAYLVANRFDHVFHEVKNREFVTLSGTLRGIPMSVIGTGIGTDNVEIALTEAYVAYEFNLKTGLRQPGLPPMRIIRIGTSGGVQNSIEPGIMGITAYALGLDSTGLYYNHPIVDPACADIERKAGSLIESSIPGHYRFKGKIFPYCSRANPEILSALKNRALSNNIRFEECITVSSPGFYGPSSRFIMGFDNTLTDIKGCLAGLSHGSLRTLNMEMESSLLFHLAGKIGYPAGTICPVISNPRKSTSIIDYQEKISVAIDLAVGAMLDLSDRD